MNRRAPRFAPFALGALLMIAAGLKTISLLEHAPHEGVKGIWLEWAVIIGEAGLALWLWSGKHVAFSARIALACFCGFAVVNLWKITLDVENCGCFGPWRVAPTYSCRIDVAAIYCGLFSPGIAIRQRQLWPAKTLVASVAVASLCLWSGGVLSAKHYSKAYPQRGAQPELRAGSNWPKPGEIDSSADFRHGRWVVMLSLGSCGRCRGAVEDLVDQTKIWRSQRKSLRVALVATQDNGDFSDLRIPEEIQLGRYKQSQGFGLPPVVLFLEGGQVQAVCYYSSGIQWDSTPGATWRD